MSLVSLFHHGLVYPLQGSLNGGAAPSSDSAASGPSSPNAPLSSRTLSSQPPASDVANSSVTDDEADTTYTSAYVRSAANASGASPASLPSDDTKTAAKGETTNALADTQKRFSELMARLDASSQKTTESSAAKPTDGAPASSSEPASTSAARLKTVIAAYAANYATDRTAAFSV